MRFLLDENLSGRAAEAMTVVDANEGDEYGHVLQYAPQSTDDDALPRICRDHRFDAIVTVNVRGPYSRVTFARAGPACLTTFVSDSWITR